MSTLTNWLAINKQIDALPQTYARTVLNWIMAFETMLTRLDTPGIMDNFAVHKADTNNPHKVTLDQLSGTLSEAVYAYYEAYMAPNVDPSKVIGSLDEFNTLLETNPILLLEIMRDAVLNNVYGYQDLVGPRSKQPFYVVDDGTKVKIPTPYYAATGIYPDLTLQYYNTLSRQFSDNGFVNLSIVFGFRIISTSVDPAVWRLTLNDTPITLTYVSSTKTFHFTFDENVYAQISQNNVIMPITNGTSTEGLELRGVLRVSPTAISLMYSVDGVLTKTVVTITSNATPIRYGKFTLSHAFWDNQTDETATTHLSIYPSIINDRTADLFMSCV